MRKHEFLRELSRRMEKLAWPGKQTSRVVQEIGDHWDDLESEAGERGLDGSAATAFVNERIGEPEALVRVHQERMRQVHWSGRHPVVSFALMPPLLLGVWFMWWTVMAAAAGEFYSKL